MQITMLDISGEAANIEPEDIKEGDLIAVFTFKSKDDAGVEGRKLVKLMPEDLEFIETEYGVLIKKRVSEKAITRKKG
jgi:hypothetical protein